MRVRFAASLIAGLAVCSCAGESLAQWDWNKIRARGLFGDRTLGEPIQPQPSTRFGNSYWRGPSGNFLGRDSSRPGMMFPSPYGTNNYGPPEYSEVPPQIMSRGLRYTGPGAEFPPFIAPQVPPPRPREFPPPAVAEGPPEAPEAPQIWFRGSPPPNGATAEMPSQPAAASTAVGPAVAVVGVAPAMSGSAAPPASLARGLGAAGSLDELLSQSLQAQIARIPRFQDGPPIRVSVASGVATLQGAVPSQHDRKVLSEFIRMEPGIWDVDNQLAVQP